MGDLAGEIDLIALDPGRCWCVRRSAHAERAPRRRLAQHQHAQMQERICATARHFLSQHLYPALRRADLTFILEA